MEDFRSRRSPVVSVHGCVASSQPLATQAGLEILKKGGNAADAAVAVAAALNVTEPCSTGIGGDCFCLFYDAKSKTVHGLNGSGRSPRDMSLEMLNTRGYNADNPIPVQGALAVTVPGAAAGWLDTIEKFGSKKLSVREILEPAICLAEDGYPVHPICAYSWEKGSFLLKDPKNIYGGDMLLNGKAPRVGEIMKMPLLANTFKELASGGKSSFYEGRIGEAIVSVVQEHGGVLSLDDLKNHTTTYDEPISVDYKGVRVWEMPPNGQGITALMALNILEAYDLKGMGHNSSQYLHTLIEALRLSFADTTWYCTDPSKVNVPIKELLSEKYAAERRKLIDGKRAITDATRGSPYSSSDTVYFSVVDGNGNACSFIVSNYMGFGTGLVPSGCGFTLQNRGANFTLQPDHPNVVAPNKRPFHTIIPAMATSAKTGELLANFGVMGGFMQPQGHVQVLLNMVEFGMNPQEALDQPRFCIGPGHTGISSTISLEHGIDSKTVLELVNMGHLIDGPITGLNRSVFGRGQIITKGAWWSAGRNPSDQLFVCDDCKVLWAGSDPRADGMAAAVL